MKPFVTTLVVAAFALSFGESTIAQNTQNGFRGQRQQVQSGNQYRTAPQQQPPMQQGQTGMQQNAPHTQPAVQSEAQIVGETEQELEQALAELQTAHAQHVQVLQGLLHQVPEQARPALERAIANSQRGAEMAHTKRSRAFQRRQQRVADQRGNAFGQSRGPQSAGQQGRGQFSQQPGQNILGGQGQQMQQPRGQGQQDILGRGNQQRTQGQGQQNILGRGNPPRPQGQGQQNILGRGNPPQPQGQQPLPGQQTMAPPPVQGNGQPFPTQNPQTINPPAQQPVPQQQLNQNERGNNNSRGRNRR